MSSVLRAALCVTLLAPAAAAQPSGYTIIPATPLPDSLREVRLGGRFTVSIVRAFNDTLEQLLIERAESLVPPAGAIEAATAGITGSGHVAAFERAKSMPGPRWWWREWDRVLLPYALTGAAVAHLVDRVRVLSASPNPVAKYEPGVQHRASVTYTATVARRAPDGLIVTLNVDFRLFCGGLCGLHFTHSRVVTFDRHGNVTTVRGDGAPQYVVS